MMLALATLAAYLHMCATSVAPDTMRAIVSVESRGYIYAINDNTSRVAYCVPGAAIFPCNRDKAASLADKALRSGHSVDVGIAQVNSGNFRTYGVSATQMLDPCENLRIGSRILADSYDHSMAHFADQRRALWHAIMAYNTGSLFAGDNYARSVVAAAFASANVPTVPSIAILTTANSQSNTSGPTRFNRDAKRSVKSRRSMATASSAPLVARFLENTRKGDIADGLGVSASR